VIVLLAMAAVAELLIGSEVRRFSQTAQGHFPGKRVEALMAMVECESCSLQDRNHAVWALGQLDDPRALPVLEKYYTGARCDHLRNLCQDHFQIARGHLRYQDNKRSESVLWRGILPAED
jgi:hypothetical protein